MPMALLTSRSLCMPSLAGWISRERTNKGAIGQKCWSGGVGISKHGWKWRCGTKCDEILG